MPTTRAVGATSSPQKRLFYLGVVVVALLGGVCSPALVVTEAATTTVRVGELTSNSSRTTTTPTSLRSNHYHHQKPVAVVDYYNNRQLQTTTTSSYVADYKGRFHYYLFGQLCSGAKASPKLVAACPNGGTIALHRVSHPTVITCHVDADSMTVTGSTKILCTTNCTLDADCQKVFLSKSDVPNFYDGPYGEIDFSCNGPTLETTTGSFTYLGTTSSNSIDPATEYGYCKPFPTAVLALNAARVAQLGVLCPATTTTSNSSLDNNNNNTKNTYVYDDYYADCVLNGDVVSLALTPQNYPDNVTNNYACWNAKDCAGQECNITFADDLAISAEVDHFAQRCIRTVATAANDDNGNNNAVQEEITATPTPRPVLNPRRQIVAKFNFELGMEAVPITNNNNNSIISNNPLTCTVNRPDVTIQCTNGMILFVESTLGINPCAQPDNSTLVCPALATTTMAMTLSAGDRHTFTYTCTSSNNPMTVATLAPTTSSCPDATRQFATLGVYCAKVNKPDFIYIDQFFECGNLETLFGIRSPGYGNRLTCFTPLPTGATAVALLPGLSIHTGQLWNTAPSLGSCAQLLESSADTFAPVMAPVVPAPIDNRANDGSYNGVVIAVSVVGVVVVLVLLGIFWVLYDNNKKKSQLHGKNHGNNNDPSTNSDGVAQTNTFGQQQSSLGGPPAPMAHDYNSLGAPMSTPFGGLYYPAVQVANVISVDGPIENVDSIPALYFPRAGAAATTDNDLRTSQNSHGSNDSYNLRGSHNSPSSKNVRFKDQASDIPTSSSSGGGCTIDELSDPTRVPGTDSHGNSSSGTDSFLPIPHLAATTTTTATTAMTTTRVVDVNDSSCYKANESQSVIGEVQAVNDVPLFFYPGRNNNNTITNSDNNKI